MKNNQFELSSSVLKSIKKIYNLNIFCLRPRYLPEKSNNIILDTRISSICFLESVKVSINLKLFIWSMKSCPENYENLDKIFIENFFVKSVNL